MSTAIGFANSSHAIGLAASLVETYAGGQAALRHGDTLGIGTSALFHRPTGLALSSDGALLYVSDFSNHKIKMVDVGSRVVSLLAGSGSAGSADGSASVASFNQPYALAFSADGSVLYCADYAGHRLRSIVVASGAVGTLAGSGTFGSTDGAATTAPQRLTAGPSMLQ